MAEPIKFEEKRVLIVDDNAGMRSSMRAILSNMGVTQSEMASSANDAIRRIQTRPFDIIICDYFLGDESDGQQLLEQLRHNKLIPLTTAFVMVTAERAYERVVSAVELAPDDYLIKPFTAEILKTRLERVLEKKAALSPIYSLLERGRFADATRVCEQLLEHPTKYVIDILRLLGELHVAQGNFEQAQQIYQQVLDMRAVPWARMGLAKMLHFNEKNEEAEEILDAVIAEAPDYMAAYDLLSKVCDAQQKTDRAQEVLAQAVSASPYTMHRQKSMGDIAMRNGDLESAEKAFTQVVERGKTSYFREAADYANLSRVQMERGKTNEALSTMRDARTSFNNSHDVQFTSAVMESLIHKKAGNEAAAAKALDTAFELQAQHDLRPNMGLSLDMANACLQQNRDEDAKRIVETLVKNNHDNNALLDKAKQLFESAGKGEMGKVLVEESVSSIVSLNNLGVRAAQQGDYAESVRLLTEAASKLPDNMQIVLNAAQVLLVAIDKQGWNDNYMQSARQYLGMVRNKRADHPKLLSINKFAQDVARKYGMAA